nr:tail protein [bacterium]
MTASYLHGVETIEVEKGIRPVKQVKTAVIGVPVVAPIWELDSEYQSINELKVVRNMNDAAKYFGSDKTGYTAYKTFDAIFKQGYGTVIALNVFDPDTHKTSVTDEAKDFGTDDTLTLAHVGVANVVVTNSGGTTTYDETDDYTVDYKTGVITRVETGSITSEESVLIDYDYADPSKVAKEDIIGSDAATRTGMYAFKDAFSNFGYNPKILIAPEFSHNTEVWSAMLPVAENLRAAVLADIDTGKTVDEAIAARGTSGTHNSSSDRLIICYPRVKISTDGTTMPLSVYLSGVMAAKDIKEGYHVSPSNTEIKGIIGLERPLTAAINDPTSEVNALNEAGIVTVFNQFGTGFRTWGNRSAAYPSVTHPKNFINVRRTADVVDESVEYYTLQYLDKNINKALIDAIVESSNAFIRGLIGRGALIGGECWFDKENNPDEEMAAGHLVFDRDILPPSPAERISYRSAINVDLYSNVA